MKKLLSAIIMLALVSSVGWASVPDPDYCVVSPQDAMDCPRIVGIPDCNDPGDGHIQIYVRATGGIDIENCYVEIVFSPACEDTLCYCDCLDLTGYTDENGYIDFYFEMGGCCRGTAAACILADGVPIRQYDFVVSPDHGANPPGRCEVGLSDLQVFGAAYGSTGASCTDYDGNCETGLGDFSIMARVYGFYCTE